MVTDQSRESGVEEPSDIRTVRPYSPVAEDAHRILGALREAGVVVDTDVHERLRPAIEAAVEAMHQRIGEGIRSVADYLVGPPGSVHDLMRVVGAEYVGTWGTWFTGHSGVAWLHPKSPYRFTIRGGITFEAVFEPEMTSIDTPLGPAEIRDYAQVVPDAERPSTLRVLIGLQSFEKMVPLRVALNSQSPTQMPSIEVLIHLNLVGVPYPSGPMVRVDYATYYRELSATHE